MPNGVIMAFLWRPRAIGPIPWAFAHFPRYYGEPVAVVAAVDEATAREAVKRIKLRLEELPAYYWPVPGPGGILDAVSPVDGGEVVTVIRIVRLGSPRAPDEGLRIGTVRRPPRGVPKADYARLDFYDVWLPNLSPSPELVKDAQGADNAQAWSAFTRKFRSEMGAPDASKVLDLLAALSHQTNLSIGCYCAEESRCHRSVLKELLRERDANIG